MFVNEIININFSTYFFYQNFIYSYKLIESRIHKKNIFFSRKVYHDLISLFFEQIYQNNCQENSKCNFF